MAHVTERKDEIRQISFRVESALARKFKAAAALAGKEQQDVLRDLILDYTKKIMASPPGEEGESEAGAVAQPVATPSKPSRAGEKRRVATGKSAT